MLRLPRSVRVFVSATPVHCRTGIDGMVRLVRDEFCEDPFTGNIFCFFSRRRDRVTLLTWDRNGFWIFRKRLERGCFESLHTRGPPVEIERETLVMLLEGIDTRTSRFRRHFAREVRISSRADDDRPARAAQ